MRFRSLVLLAMAILPSLALAQVASSNESENLRLEGRMMAQAQQVAMITSKLPRVNVTHQDFGQGCPNPADPEGLKDSTCAIRNAIQFAQKGPIPGGGYPILYFPHGRYRVAGTGFSPALLFTAGIGMVGDGPGSSVLYNASPTAGLVAYNKITDCNHKPGACFLDIEGITFAGAGHTTMGGLIEINSTNTGVMKNVVLTSTGGIALNLQGSSERWLFTQMDINEARWSVVTEGDTNENYFDRVNVTYPGIDESHFCFSVNCPGGRMAQTNLWLPDPHAAVFLDGDNVHWMNSSIKTLAWQGGIRLAAVTASVSRTYFEGMPVDNQPRNNFAIEVGGKVELGHLTRSISSSDLLVPVDEAGWQPLYVNDPATANINDIHAYTNSYSIFPADYVWGSKDPSSAVPGITRGTFERVKVASFAGDGNGHLIARGQNNTRPVAWPAGSVIEQEQPHGGGSALIESNHLDSTNYTPNARIPTGCDDTAPAPNWTSHPSRMCAEIIAGLVPDGYGIPYPSQHYGAGTFSLDVVDNAVGIAGDELNGKGWIKIASTAVVNLNQGDRPLTKFADAGTATTQYINGGTRVQLVQWGKSSALGVVHDMSANVQFSPQDRYYASDIVTGNSLSHQYLNEQCWYAIQPGGAQPQSRFCIRPSGPAQETFTNGHWTAATH